MMRVRKLYNKYLYANVNTIPRPIEKGASKENHVSTPAIVSHVTRVITVLLLLLLVAAILPACSISMTTGPSEGTVIDKKHEEGEFESKTSKVCTGTGKKRKCSNKTTTDWDDPDFELLLRSCDKDDECDEGWIEVSESEYNSAEVGDYFSK